MKEVNLNALLSYARELEWFPTALRTAFLLLVCLPLVLLGAKWIRIWVVRKSTAQKGMLAGKAVSYGGLAIIAVSILHELGFSLTPLLGAAGIVGVALGFASQTSVSNIISGLFLIGEQPFEVGDILTVGDTTGLVESIDFLSVKLRTFDNHFVRIPNETLVKSSCRNATYYPIRRLDVRVGVAYKEDLQQVFEVLRGIARANPFCLDEPEPLIVVDGFGDSSVNILFGVWCVQKNFLPLKNTIYSDVLAGFKTANIEIPFPHLSLYAGEATKPIPFAQPQLRSNDSD